MSRETESSKNDMYIFIMNLLKSFIILLIIGKLLPDLLRILLEKVYGRSYMYKNSIFVYNLVDKNEKIFYNFIIVLESFLQQ